MEVTYQQGGVYLARLDPAKGAEIGKLRPVVILNNNQLLASQPPLLFVCPLSSTSHQIYEVLHIPIMAKDRLLKTSFALVEHSRSLSVRRVQPDQLCILSPQELRAITHCLWTMIDTSDMMY